MKNGFKKLLWVVVMLTMIPTISGETTYTANSDTTFEDGHYITNTYSYRRYFQEGDSWQSVNENFQATGCGDFTYCVPSNSYQFYLNSNSLTANYQSGEETFSTQLDSLLGTSLFNYNLQIQDNVATYRNIVPGVDLQYIYIGDRLKETIIIKEPIGLVVANPFIRFRLDNTQDYSLQDNGQVSIDSLTDAPISISQAVMFDEGTYTKTLNYTMSFDGVNRHLILQLPLGDIAEHDIQYPLYIDPPITFNETPSYNTLVTEVRAGASITNQVGLNSRMFIGVKKDAGTVNKTTYRNDIGFDVSSIFPNATVLGAELRIFQLHNGTFETNMMYIRHMKFNFSTFTTNLAYYSDAGDGEIYNTTNASETNNVTGGFIVLNLTNAKNDIEINLSSGFFGMGLQSTDETVPVGQAADNRRFRNSGGTNISRRPLLTIQWQNDSCRYFPGTGNWNISCNDNCTWDDGRNIIIDPGINITMNGTGAPVLRGGNITGFTDFVMWGNSASATCDLFIHQDGTLLGDA